MIKFELGIRYLSQLRRTRPNDIGRLEASAAGALRDCGAAVGRDGSLLTAEFSPEGLSVWLDVAVALEGVASALSLAEKELLGRSCLLRVDPGADGKDRCRALSALDNRTGIWCDRSCADALSEYAVFHRVGEWFALDAFTLRERPPLDADRFWVRGALAEEISALALDDPAAPKRAFAVEGPALCGKRQTLRAVLRRGGSRLAVLRVSFDETGRNAASIADALNEDRLKEIAAADPAAAEAVRADMGAADTIRAARFSLEPSAERRAAFAKFLRRFVEVWLAQVPPGTVPVLAAEDVHFADAEARALLRAVFAGAAESGRAHFALTSRDADAVSEVAGGTCLRLRAAPPSPEEWQRMLDGSALAPPPEVLFLLSTSGGIAAAFRAAAGWKQRADGSLGSAHPRLSGDLLETAYALSLSNCLFPPEEIFAVFEFAGKPRAALPVALQRLKALGIVDDEREPRIAVPRFDEFAEAVLGQRARKAKELVLKRLSYLMERKRIQNAYETIVRRVALGGAVDDDSILDAVVDGLLRGESAAVDAAIRDGSFVRVVGEPRAAGLASVFATRKALLFGDEDASRAAFAEPVPDLEAYPRCKAFSLLDRASYAFSVAHLDAASAAKAAAAAKNALMLLQSEPAKKGLPRAYRLLGEAELARERIAEAIDYFGFAAESAERSGDAYEAMLSAVNGAGTQYLLGNIAKAEREAAETEHRARSLYLDDWRSWGVFMRGRIAFAAGRYDRAAELFDSLGAGTGSAGLFPDWRDRSLAFADSSIGASFLGDSADAPLFRIEAALLQRKYEEVVSASDAFLAEEPRREFRNPERLCLSGGFVLVEDRAVGRSGGDGVPRRLVKVYRSLALSKMGRAAESVAELHRIAKEEPVSELDPYDAFYFWALSSCLRVSGAPTVDWHTVLSLAFKRLQRRASRIDDADLKRDFTLRNRWNALLYADAKSINLI